MIKKENIRILLGISQENLAHILKVSRSQLAMYEIGKRNLPVHALEILSEMLVALKNNASNNANKNILNTLEKDFLQRLILKNEHQQHIVENKINALLKKQNALDSSKKIVEHLIKNISIKNELIILESISAKTATKMSQTNSEKLLQLQVKKEVLIFEEKLLKEKITPHYKSEENSNF